MNEMRKIMETLGRLEENEFASANDTKLGKLLNKRLREHETRVEQELNKIFAGKTVRLHELVYTNGRHEWQDIDVPIAHIEYSEHDVNGPVFVDTDGKRHHTHPEYEVIVVGR